jgi:hypothetical protein
MKKIFTFGILAFVLTLAVVVPSSGSAQLTGGLATYQKFLAGQVKCSEMTNSDFFDIGDYVLKQVPEDQRGAINEYINQYKGKLSDKDFSTLMGKYFTGCEIPAPVGIGSQNTSGDNSGGNEGNNNDNGGDNKGENKGDANQPSGEEHRSSVSTFVQNLLDVANREGGIGEQVRTIANAQNDSKDNVANAIDNVKNRAGWKTFLIGTDYKSIGQLRSSVTTTTNQVDQLTKLADQAANPVDKATLDAAVKIAQQQLQKMDDFIKANESKFSLFGWLVKLFVK